MVIDGTVGVTVLNSLATRLEQHPDVSAVKVLHWPGDAFLAFVEPAADADVSGPQLREWLASSGGDLDTVHVVVLPGLPAGEQQDELLRMPFQTGIAIPYDVD